MVFFVWLVLAVSALQAGVTPAQYAARRTALRNVLADGVTVLFGGTEKPTGNLETPFFQEPNFYYLTGWSEPGAVLLVDPVREILFLPRRDPEVEKWTGRKAAPDDPGIETLTGFTQVMPVEWLEKELHTSLQRGSRLYALKDTPQADKLAQAAALRELSDVRRTIARLRMKKSPEEIELIRWAADASVAAHLAAWRRLAAGLFEYQVAGTIVAAILDTGCGRPAYAPIVGSGPNSVTLHHNRNRRRMDAGELLLIDAGAECGGYASDLTRTVPVSGKFTPRQRELYEIVLGAQKAAIAAVKPGATLSRQGPDSLYQAAYRFFETNGQDRQGRPLGRYFTHGIGHHVGLEVHDAVDGTLPLEAGMVVTVEPGLYLPEENIGIRIEDIVVVTANGARVLSAALPKEAAEIERALRR